MALSMSRSESPGQLIVSTGFPDDIDINETQQIIVQFEESKEIAMIPQGDIGAIAPKGIPKGGTTGQYLRKVSDEDYDTEWASFTHYVHTQAIASNLWTINHNLGRYPSVTVVDTANSKVYGDVFYNDENSLTISFNGAFSGKAFLN